MNIETFTVDLAFKEINSRLPTVDDLKKTEQDPGWHAEGDVYIHTCNVVDEAKKLAVEYNLTEKETLVLLYASAYHDIAKPLCTKLAEVRGQERVTSPNHEDMGASLLSLSKKPESLTDSEWLLTIKLVKYHKDGKLLIARNKDERYIFKLFLNACNMKLLYLLSKADMLGRTCDDLEEQIMLIDIFKEECIRLDIFNIEPSEYLTKKRESLGIDKTNHDKFMIGFRDYCSSTIGMFEECTLMPYFYEDVIPTVHIAVGLPASGKTHLRKHIDYDVLISLDDIANEMKRNKSIKFDQGKVMAKAKNILKQALRERKNVYWDATNYRVDFRSKIIDISNNYGDLFRNGVITNLHIIIKDIDSLLSDNKSRETSIPDKYILDSLLKYQLPDDSEAIKTNWYNSNLQEVFL